MLSHAHTATHDAVDEMRQVQIEKTGSLWHKEGINALYTGCGEVVSYRVFVTFRRADFDGDLCEACHTPFELAEWSARKEAVRRRLRGEP